MADDMLLPVELNDNTIQPRNWICTTRRWMSKWQVFMVSEKPERTPSDLHLACLIILAGSLKLSWGHCPPILPTPLGVQSLSFLLALTGIIHHQEYEILTFFLFQHWFRPEGSTILQPSYFE